MKKVLWLSAYNEKGNQKSMTNLSYEFNDIPA